MAIIKMPKRKSKKPQSKFDMKKLIDYVKKHENENGLTVGINCNTFLAYQEFIMNKKLHHKTDGRLYIHMVQSFPKESITPEKAFELGQRLIDEFEKFSNFQIVMGTHTDREHIHNHFCINSVGLDGQKWQMSTWELNSIREKSLDICREAEIPIWWDKNNQLLNINIKKQANSDDELHTVHQGEYEKQKQGKSWKYELFLAIKECTRHSHDQKEFMRNMQKLGFGVQWDEQHKYITFTTPEGKKCRNNKLYPIERFTKDYLLDQFSKNSERRSIQTIQDHQRKMDQTAGMVKQLIQAIKNKGNHFNDDFFPLTHIKSKLEGQALIDKAIEKSNSSYDWENEF